MIAAACVAVFAMCTTLDKLPSTTTSSSSMALASTLAARTALHEVLDITATSPTLSTAHVRTSMAPANTHDTRFPAFPPGLCVSSVEHTPNFWPSRAID